MIVVGTHGTAGEAAMIVVRTRTQAEAKQTVDTALSRGDYPIAMDGGVIVCGKKKTAAFMLLRMAQGFASFHGTDAVIGGCTDPWGNSCIGFSASTADKGPALLYGVTDNEFHELTRDATGPRGTLQ